MPVTSIHKQMGEVERLKKARRRDYNRRWREEHRTELQDYRDRNKDHRSRIEWLRLLRDYGLTEDQYDSVFKAQRGLCAICCKPEQKRRLAVDHDHKTGRVRGLLCWWCNNKLLAARNTALMFRRAADYLESDFDARLIELARIELPLLVQPVTVTGEKRRSGQIAIYDRALAAIRVRLLRDPIVRHGELVFLTAETWRRMNGSATVPA